MGKGDKSHYPLAVRRAVMDKAIFQGAKLADLQKEFGVSLSTLKRWSMEGAWSKQAKKYRDFVEINDIEVVELYLEAKERAKETQDKEDFMSLAILYPVARDIMNRKNTETREG